MPTGTNPTPREWVLCEQIMTIADACRVKLPKGIDITGPMVIDLAEQTATHVGHLSERIVAIAEELGLTPYNAGCKGSADIRRLADEAVDYLKNRSGDPEAEQIDAAS